MYKIICLKQQEVIVIFFFFERQPNSHGVKQVFLWSRSISVDGSTFSRVHSGGPTCWKRRGACILPIVFSPHCTPFFSFIQWHSVSLFIVYFPCRLSLYDCQIWDRRTCMFDSCPINYAEDQVKDNCCGLLKKQICGQLKNFLWKLGISCYLMNIIENTIIQPYPFSKVWAWF